MCEAKTTGMLQAVTERAVETDMRQPDQCKHHGERLAEHDAADAQQQRRDGCMHRVVGGGAEAGSCGIGEKTQIREEKKAREQFPVAANPPVECNCTGEQHQPLDAQQAAYAAIDRSRKSFCTAHCTASTSPEDNGAVSGKQELAKNVERVYRNVWR